MENALARRLHRRKRCFGFTLIELIIVVLIIITLFSIAVPSFSKLFKTSKVQQAAQAVFTSVWHARSSAQSLLGQYDVAVYYGDDLTQLSPKPIADVLPEWGQMSIWAVRTNRELIDYTTGPYCPETPSSVPVWYPFCYPRSPLLSAPHTLPTDIRALAGRYVSSVSSGKPYRTFYFPDYQRSAKGEIKRHSSVFGRNGGLSAASYEHLLLFDPSSGSHIVLEVGSKGAAATRPRIVVDPGAKQPATLTHIGHAGKYLPSNASVKPIADFRQLGNLVNTDPGDN
jgi:type II secretory pathway pseudopilin PulG